MNNIKVISLKICPFVQRVTATLVVKSIDFDIEYISLKDAPDWFTKISPNRQVPLLICKNATVLFESDAIVEYLDDAYTPLQPSLNAEQKAINRAWSYLASKNYLLQCGAMSSNDESTFKERLAKIQAVFTKIESALPANSKFFNGDNIGNVDLAWLVLLHRFAIVAKYTNFDFTDGFTKVKRWQQNILSSCIANNNIAEQSVIADFEQIFCDYYLTNNYLATKRL